MMKNFRIKCLSGTPKFKFSGHCFIFELLNLAERKQDLCFLRLCFLPLFLSHTKPQIVILFVTTICRGNYDMMLFSLMAKLVLT